MTTCNRSNTELNKTSNDRAKWITITINQKPQQVGLSISLQQLIVQFSLPEIGCVFAINNQVVPRSEWASTVLSEGDRISLFQAISGG